jgi:hypothetical protein
MSSGLRNSEAAWTERRVRERVPVCWTGTLVHEQGEEACAIMDFSPRGARVTASNVIPINRSVSLRLTEHGEFLGRVVWRSPNFMGLKFQHLEDTPAALRPGADRPIRFVS